MADPDFQQIINDLAAAISKNAGVKEFEFNGRKFTLESANATLLAMKEAYALQAALSPGDATTLAEYTDPR